MSDLIRRADAIEAVRFAEHRFTVADEQHGMGTVKWDLYGVYTAEAVEALKALPSAEAVQGEWILDEDSDDVRCSVCGHLALLRVVMGDVGLQEYSNFCPNCGSRMQGGDAE